MRRGRFAPTPSGQLHIGNAWTALLSWLQMRHVGGEFVLRMEDIDKPRSRQEYADQILNDLNWLGLDWDEGPDLGGPHGSYTQSEREALYEEALEQLKGKGWLAYLSNLQDRPEPVRAAELVVAFDLSRVPKETVTVSEKMLRELHCL